MQGATLQATQAYDGAHHTLAPDLSGMGEQSGVHDQAVQQPHVTPLSHMGNMQAPLPGHLLLYRQLAGLTRAFLHSMTMLHQSTF